MDDSRAPGNYPPSVPTSQIIAQIINNQLHINRIWLAIGGSYGQLGLFLNRHYLLDSVDRFQAAGFEVGIQSGQDYWNYFLGNWTEPELTSLPLIYEHLDEINNFDDWQSQSFADWTQPTGKINDYSACFTESFTLIYKE